MKNILLLMLLLFCLVRPVAADDPTSPTLRIISCAPNLTGMLLLLGMEDSIVGISTHTTWPEEAADIPQVADLFNPNLEAMMRLRPTHVLGLESTVKINEFFQRRTDVEVLTFGRIESLEEIDSAFLRLAEAFDRRHLAEEYLRNRRVSQRDETEGEPVRVLFVLGYGSGLSQLTVIGHGTYVSELIERAGGHNVVPEHLGIYPSLNKEALLAMRPDVIVSTARPGMEDSRLREMRRDWRPLASIPAVRNGDFRFITEPSFLIPGPWSLNHQLYLEELFHESGPGGSVPAANGD